MSDADDDIPEVPWPIKLGLGIVALIVAAGILAYAQWGGGPSEQERTWVANLRELGIDEATAERLAAEVRSGAARQHDETGNLSQDVANYQDDVRHMAAIYWWRARDDARRAHATAWRRRAVVPGAVAAIALLLAWLGFRRQRRG